MNRRLRRAIARGAVAVATTGGVVAAAHAAVDTTEVISAITTAGLAAAGVGAAVLVLHVGIKVYKWIRGAM